MGWFLAVVIMSMLFAFNLYASNSIVKFNRELKETRKAVMDLEKSLSQKSEGAKKEPTNS